MAEYEILLRTGHAHVEETPFLIYIYPPLREQCIGDHTVLASDDKDAGELEPLCGMYGHKRCLLEPFSVRICPCPEIDIL